MNISKNLFSLMNSLCKLYDSKKIIELFVETMTDEFKPARFHYIEKCEKGTGIEIEIITEKSLYGFIRIEQQTPLVKEHYMLIGNAVKMLAVFLERAEFEAKFQNALLTSEKTANEQILKHQEMVKEHLTDRKASLSLIENLKEKIKNRVQFENELKQSEECYRLLLENSLDAILLTAPDGSVFSANSAACEMFQMTEQEICSLGRNGLVDLTDSNLQSLIEIRNKTGKAKGDLRFIRKDGSVFPAEISSSIFTNEKGEIRNSLIIRDVSERNCVKGELEHANDLMKYVIEHANGAVAIHDNELRYIYVSERYLNDYKVKEFNIIGKHHYDVFPDLPKKWRDIHQRVLRGEVCSSECDLFQRDDGTLEWTRWECRPWIKVDGTIGGLIVYTEVITKQVLAENALRESEARFRLLAETAPFGIVIFDRNRDIMFINQQFVRIFGYTISELPSVDAWWPLAYPDKVFRDEVHSEWDRLISKAKNDIEKLQTVEYPVQCKDGAIKLIEFRLATTAELNFITFIDITERKHAENELKQLKSELEFQVDEKTKELKLRVAELERFQDATIEREFRIKELRDELKLLKGATPK
jgi:PAS domain S-box-containing protein